MTYSNIDEWKQEIRDIFKLNAGYPKEAQDIQADAFEEMHSDCKLSELPEPMECYEAEMDAANS